MRSGSLRGVLGGALVGCAAFVAAGCGTGDADPSRGTVAPPVVSPASVPACPAWDVEPTYPDGPLPQDAVSLRVCPGELTLQDPHWTAAIAAPRDALLAGVPELVALLNNLPDWEVLPAGTYCTQEGRPRIHYVFGYADGSSRSVTYGYGECHLLEISAPGDFPDEDTIAKTDAPTFMRAVAEAIVMQRGDVTPPSRIPPPPRCVPNTRATTTLPTERLTLHTAALCVLDGRGRWQRAVIPAHLVGRLTADYTAASPSDTDCGFEADAKVVGWSTWGDPVELAVAQGRCATPGTPWEREPRYWTVSPDLADELLALPLGAPVPQR